MATVEQEKMQKVSEAYDFLYHYTTAAGLCGIVKDQQLWATHMAYLNDAEERIGFFSRRLPALLEEPIRSAFEQLAKDAQNARLIDERGGIEHATESEVAMLTELLRQHTVEFDDAYITAFCGPPPNQEPHDGLLSQWRAYGTDGGYAIVFRTQSLEELLIAEGKVYPYHFLGWGDVDYYNSRTGRTDVHPEAGEAELFVQSAIKELVTTGKKVSVDLYQQVTLLSCRHKHSGFREEAEVRIMAIPITERVYAEATKRGETRGRKHLHSYVRNGVLVPHIKLFERYEDGKQMQLPIDRVIVGPHADSMKRKRATEILLAQCGVKAQVVMSEIPYRGR
jgi:hypothetical protein